MKVIFTLLITLIAFTGKVLANPITANVTTFGANGSDKQDDTQAIQAAIDYVAERKGGTVYFPAGTYYISNQKIAGKAICLEGKSDVTYRGENRDEAIVKLAERQPNYSRIVSLIGVSNAKFINLTFDGNYANQNNPDKPNEHLAAIYMDRVDSATIDSCNFINTGGDGIGMRGVSSPSENILIQNSFFDANQRNGITLGSGYRDITIRKNVFGKNIKNSPIDSEPTSGICGNVTISDNDIQTSNLLTVGGSSIDNLADNINIRNNKMNGSIFIIYSRDVIIENNTLTNDIKRAAFTLLRRNKNITIRNNKINVAKDNSAFYLAYSANTYSEDVDITNNTINFNSANADCFDIRGCEGLKISGNKVKNTTSGKNLINLVATRPISSFEFSNNESGYFNQNLNVRSIKNNSIQKLVVNKNRLANKEIKLSQALKNTVLKQIITDNN